MFFNSERGIFMYQNNVFQKRAAARDGGARGLLQQIYPLTVEKVSTKIFTLF